MARKSLNYKIDAEKLVPFIAAIMNIQESDVKVAMQLRKDLILAKNMINMKDPLNVEAEISKLGSKRRVNVAIKTLKYLNLIIEKTDPNTKEHVLVRNLSSEDGIKILERLSRDMMKALKQYVKNPDIWPNVPRAVFGGYAGVALSGYFSAGVQNFINSYGQNDWVWFS